MDTKFDYLIFQNSNIRLLYIHHQIILAVNNGQIPNAVNKEIAENLSNYLQVLKYHKLEGEINVETEKKIEEFMDNLLKEHDKYEHSALKKDTTNIGH